MLNSVNLVGNLGRDIELQQSKGGKNYTRFSLAVADSYNRDRTDWINCVAFGKTAEILANYTGKGSTIGVTGRLTVDSYQDKDGNNRQSTTVTVDNVSLIGKRQQSEPNVQMEIQRKSAQQARAMQDPFADDAESVNVSEDDLPF